VSALQKAIRRSQPAAAVYWGYELWNSGYDNWAWSRLREIASEDIGIADRGLPANLAELERVSKAEAKKKPGAGKLQFVHAVLLLATAEKSRLVALMTIVNDSDHHERLEIPDEALDRHTRRGRAMGRGFEHFIEEAARIVQPQDARLDRLPELEADYRSQRIAVAENAKENLPKNPWRRKADHPGVEESWLPEDREPNGDVQEEMSV
jgi:replication-associated recombination protein RarA